MLTSDMQALQPTLFPTVPRLLNRIHDTVRSNVKDSRIKEFFFNLALSRKQAAVKNGVFQRDTIWDYIGTYCDVLSIEMSPTCLLSLGGFNSIDVKKQKQF